MIEALRPAYQAVLSGLLWSREQLAKGDAIVHDGLEAIDAAIAKFKAELGIVSAAGDPVEFSAGARSEADKLFASVADQN